MTSNSQGFDTYVEAGVTRPFGVSLDVAYLDEDNTYLGKPVLPIDDDDTIAAAPLTITVGPGGWGAGVSLSLSAIADDWQPSTVIDDTKPTTTGAAAVTGVLGALAEGDTVTIDVTPQVAAWAASTLTNRGWSITRLDSGAAVAMYAYDSDFPPLLEVTTQQTPPKPTGLSPAGGRAVSVAQPLLRVRNYTAGLADIELAAMQVQRSATSSFSGTLLSDDTQVVSSPEFDMTTTRRVTSADGHTTSSSATVTSASANFTAYDEGTLIIGTNIPIGTRILTYNSPTSVTMTANATGTATTTVFTIGYNSALNGTVSYWRTRLQSTDGTWSDWSDPESTRFVALGTLDITYPEGGVSTDPDPLVTYDFSGTDSQQQLTRASIADPATLLKSTGKTPTLATGEVRVGYEVQDYGSYVDTLYVWDNVDREDIPGAPSYASASVTWSLTDDITIEAPVIDSVAQLGGTSPFVVLNWTLSRLGQFKVFADSGDGDVNVSGTLLGQDVLQSEDESGRHYQWIWFGAQPGTLYDIRIRAYPAHEDGSSRSNTVSILTDTSGFWLANPTTQEYVHLWNATLGDWVRSEPMSANYGPVVGDGFYRQVKGPRWGYSTHAGGDLLPRDDARTVPTQYRQFLRMGNATDQLVLVTPDEVFQCGISNSATPPTGRIDHARHVEFDVWQTGPTTLAGHDVTESQVVTLIADAEDWTEGATVTSADTSGLISGCDGSVKARAAAAAHGSDFGYRMEDVSGGSHVKFIVNRLNFTLDAYFPNGIPGPTLDQFSLISIRAAGGGQVAAVHMKTAGNWVLQDTAGVQSAGPSGFKVRDDVPFRLVIRNRWVAGVNWLFCDGFAGANLEGTIPDISMSADTTSVAAPDGNVWVGPVTTFGSGDIDIDDIRITNTADTQSTPLGVPEGGTIVFAHASTKQTTMRVAANGIGVVTQVKVGYSTTADADGFPASPSFTSLAAVDAYGTAQVDVSGLTAGTLYYWAVADSTGAFMGRPRTVKTLPAANTSVTLKMANECCQQTRVSGSTHNPLAWQQLLAYAPDIILEQGDSLGYPGGAYTPATDISRYISDYTTVITGEPAIDEALSSASLECQISDHEVCANGQYKITDPDDPTGPKIYGPWADQAAIFQTQAQAFRKVRPVIYADGTGRGRYYFKDLIHNRTAGAVSVRLFVFDLRSMDRSDGTDTDGPAKTFMGSPQLTWFSANKLAAGHGLNILMFESTSMVSAAPDQIDKWGGFFWELQNTLAPLFNPLDTDWVGGDRHLGGFLDHTKNPILTNTDLCIASAMEMHGLEMISGEKYVDASNTPQVFGDTNDPDNPNRMFGKYEISDDNAGTISRSFSVHDANTDTDVLGPFTRNWSYT